MKGGFTSYDVFALMGYQYLSAGFDGACRLPGRSYQAEVEAAWRPMERLLLEDPDAFRGQVIALKDGCNMARRTPVADALERQLRLLTDHGYKVVTASELLERAPFRDMAPRDPYAAAAVLAVETGAMAAPEGRFRPDDAVTPVEVAQFCATRLGRTPPLGDWERISRGAFFSLIAELMP